MNNIIHEVLKVVSLDYYPDNNKDRYIKFENIETKTKKLEYFGNEQRLKDFIKEFNLTIGTKIIRTYTLKKGWIYVSYKEIA